MKIQKTQQCAKLWSPKEHNHAASHQAPRPEAYCQGSVHKALEHHRKEGTEII